MKNKKLSRDINQIASRLIEIVTNDAEKNTRNQRKKNPAAVELGTRGGKRGGIARAEKLSPDQRKEIATRAAQKRWTKR